MYYLGYTYRSAKSSFTIYIFIFILLTSVACSSVDSALYKARSIDTVDVYNDFLQSYPQSRHTEWVKARIIILDDEKVFKKYESKHTIAAYREFTDKYPKNKFIETAIKRIHESEQEAFERIYKLGTIEDFEGFIESYPSSTYLPEIRNRISWLKEIRIAIPHLSNSAHLKILKDTFRSSRYEVVYYENLSETTKENIPVVMELGRIPWQYPSNGEAKRKASDTAKQALRGATQGAIGGGIVGGVVGGLFGLLPEGRGHYICRLSISCSNLKNKFEYNSVSLDATEERLLNNNNLDHIKKAEFIAWLVSSQEIPVAFLKMALKYDSDHFPDDHFRQGIVNALGSRDRPPVELILPFLNDRSYEVKLQAVNALKQTRDPRSIEGLISTLKKNNSCEPGHIAFDVMYNLCKTTVGTLKEITGINIDSPQQWIDWWDKNKQNV